MVNAAPAVQQTPTPVLPTRPVQVARIESASMARLPDTAGPLPWFALGGALTLLGALGLRLGRRRG